MGLSVARIGGISGMSPISAISPYTKTEPMNYTVDNESEVSGSYVQSVKGTSVGSVDAVPPVRYANAQVQEADGVDSVERKREAGRAFNSIASRYQNTTTSYNADSRGQSYQAIGQNIDLFA